MKNKKKKTVSLVVLNYNGKQHLKEYFESVFRQSRIPDEILMLDNCSTDGSQEYVIKNYPKVRVVKSEKNHGTAQGSNVAFRYTLGDYIIFQSNDIRLDKDCVKCLVEHLEKDKTTGIVTSVLLNYYKDAKTAEHFIDNAGGIADIYGFGMQNYPQKRIQEIPDKGEVFFSYGGSFIIRREIYEKIGGFDDRYFTLNDDIDLSWRVRLLGYKVFYVKKSVVYHKVSATIGTIYTKATRRYWSEKNIIRTILKNGQVNHLLKNFSLYLLLLSGEMLYFILRGRFSLFLADFKAIVWNLFYLPETLSLRKKIQSMNKNDNIEKMLLPYSLKLKLFNEFKKVI